MTKTITKQPKQLQKDIYIMKHTREILVMKALNFKHSSGLSELLDNLSPEQLSNLPVKNVCAKLAIPLVDNLESACAVLSISKTRFIENAILSYLTEFDEISEEFDIFGEVDPEHSPRFPKDE